MDEPNTVRDSTEVPTGIIARDVQGLRRRGGKTSLELKIRISKLVMVSSRKVGWVKIVMDSCRGGGCVISSRVCVQGGLMGY